MSTYQSLFEVQGKIGATTFQKRKGKLIIGKTSSLTAEQIATKKAFKRTRENNREFTGSANVGKALRTGIAAAVERFADSECTGRMTGVFNGMCREATGIRGKRPIEVVLFSEHLAGYELNADTHLTQVFYAPYTLSVNSDRNTATLDLPVFVYDGLLKVPEGATDWRVVLAITAVSDHTYNNTKKAYRPVNAALNSVGAMAESAWMDIDGQLPAALQLVAALPNLPVLPASVALVVCVGIEFSQDVSGLPYIFAQNNAMQIKAVY